MQAGSQAGTLTIQFNFNNIRIYWYFLHFNNLRLPHRHTHTHTLKNPLIIIHTYNLTLTQCPQSQQLHINTTTKIQHILHTKQAGTYRHTYTMAYATRLLFNTLTTSLCEYNCNTICKCIIYDYIHNSKQYIHDSILQSDNHVMQTTSSRFHTHIHTYSGWERGGRWERWAEVRLTVWKTYCKLCMRKIPFK